MFDASLVNDASSVKWDSKIEFAGQQNNRVANNGMKSFKINRQSKNSKGKQKEKEAKIQKKGSSACKAAVYSAEEKRKRHNEAQARYSY